MKPADDMSLHITHMNEVREWNHKFLKFSDKCWFNIHTDYIFKYAS